MRIKEDFTDKDYREQFPDSRLTLRRSANIKRGTKTGYWFADCDCGDGLINKDCLVNPHWVKIGRTKSCGCLREEMAIEKRFSAELAREKKSEKLSISVSNIPIEVRNWLDNLGEGDIVKGVRSLLHILTRDKKKQPPKYLVRKQ